ncbi:MAG: hypothetical protein U9N08_05390 [Candidatus Caldatribacteriota bacterium]|nr:hypothetical protein [Candidatus Caldatribacteriota bacterium]
MPLIPNEPETTSKTVTSYKIVDFKNNTQRGVILITYVKIYDNGEASRPETHRIKGIDAIKELYAAMDAELATGKTFEEASKLVLYNALDIDGVIN